MLQERLGECVAHSTPAPRLYADMLTCIEDIRAAQRLRYTTFCDEFGVSLPVHGTWKGDPIDIDGHDDVCRHVAVRETLTGDIVAYTRVLDSEQAVHAGGFYSAQEFNLEPLTALSGRMLEIGRTCTRRDYRNGATIAVLWAKVAQILMEGQYQYLFGCASISLSDGGALYASVMREIERKGALANDIQVIPRQPLRVDACADTVDPVMPPLLKAYLRMGARICGPACHDPEFNCADVCVLLDTASLTGRYARHFLRGHEGMAAA